MECDYGGGLFLEFQPLTDCMLCEGVGHPYCRLYYRVQWGFPWILVFLAKKGIMTYGCDRRLLLHLMLGLLF